MTFAKASGTGTVSGLGTATAAGGVASKTVTGALAGPITVNASALSLTSDSTTFTVYSGGSPVAPEPAKAQARNDLKAIEADERATVAATDAISGKLRDSGYVERTVIQIQ